MNWTDYFIVSSATAGVALVWRMLLLDHPTFAENVKKIPLIGEVLYCGFCFPMWLSLFSVLAINPLVHWDTETLRNLSSETAWFLRTFFGWFSLGASVLFIRFSITTLMDATGVLSHKHRAAHPNEEKSR